MMKSLNYLDLDAALGRIGYREPSAEFHGALCGALCREPPEKIDPVDLLDDERLTLDEASLEELRSVREQTVSSFTDGERGFMPLLPDDDTPLSDRAQALAKWCDGFLFGLSSRLPLALSECTEEVREVVSDFTQFTRAAIGSGDDLEVEENAYAELVEYVRVGAQLVYMELHPRPASAADAESYNRTLH